MIISYFIDKLTKIEAPNLKLSYVYSTKTFN